MNRNMRKMYSERDIALIGGVHVYQHGVSIVDNTDNDNPITTSFIFFSLLSSKVINMNVLNNALKNFIINGSVNSKRYIDVIFSASGGKLYYFDNSDGEIKYVTLGKANKLTITDTITEFKNIQ